MARLPLFLLLSVILLGFCACGSSDEPDGSVRSDAAVSLPTEAGAAVGEIDTQIGGGLVWQQRLTTEYAQCFRIDAYEDGYLLLTVSDGRRILVIPEGKETPRGLDADILPLALPLDQVYLVASAAGDMLDRIGALGALRYCGMEASGWYVEGLRAAMERGELLYAGKYSAPDYELLTAGDCRLAIENMMISHSPEVIAKLEELGIPVVIDYASYEEHPLGRMEWVKFYGALTGRLDAACAAYEEQAAQAAGLSPTGQSVAFFYLREDGAAVVRRTDDYVPAMIRIAGGSYILDELTGDAHLSSTVMQMEEFYASAREADVLIYNGTTAGTIRSVSELLEKSPLMADFRAVESGYVYAVAQELYQNTMSLGTVIADLHRAMVGAPDEELIYLEHLY